MMDRKNYLSTSLVCSFLMMSGAALAQEFSAGINTETPNQHAVLHLVSPNGNQGLLIPQLTTDQRVAMKPSLGSESNGLLVYDNKEGIFYFWVKNNWIPLLGTDTDEQTLSLNGSILQIEGGNFVDLGSLSAESDPTVPNEVKDGISWNELKDIPEQFADGTDEEGLKEITSQNIVDGAIVDGDISATAQIAGAKVKPDFGTQSITTSGEITTTGTATAQQFVGDGSQLTGVVTKETDPIWVEDKKALGSTGTINTAANLVDWTQLKNVPEGLADGTDEEGLKEITSQNIVDGAIVDGDISATAQIAGAKVKPDFGTQSITTSGEITTTGTATAQQFVGDGSQLTGVVTKETDPIWVEDKKALGSTGTINTAANLVDWTQLKNVPEGLADGTDEEGLKEITSQNIVDGAIVDGDISATAQIAGAKVKPDFGTQPITTSGEITTTGTATAQQFVGDGSQLTGVVTKETDPVWVEDKKALGSTGTVNTAANLVDWTQLKNVPEGLADGTDEEGLKEITSQNIVDGAIVDGDISTTAQIAGAKVKPDFGTQPITTSGEITTTGMAKAQQFVGDGSQLTGVVTKETDPIWVEDKKALGSTGTINTVTNPVDWTQLKNVPEGLADGANDMSMTSLSLKDGSVAKAVAVTIKAHPTSSVYNLTLPSTLQAGFLATDASGNLSWVASGKNGLTNDTKNNQLFVGLSGAKLTSGANNILLGINSGNQITTGSDNVILGRDAGALVTTSIGNVLIGQQAETKGSNSISIGYNSGSDGSSSVTIGDRALTYADRSIALGSSAEVLLSAIESIAIGADATAKADHSIAIGFGTIAAVNNTAIIGGGGGTLYNVGIGTNAPGGRLGVTTLLNEPVPYSAVVVNHGASGGSGISLNLSNQSNTEKALVIENGGNGIGGFFRNYNPDNKAAVLWVENQGSGHGLYVDQVSKGGNAIHVIGNITNHGLNIEMPSNAVGVALNIVSAGSAKSIVTDGGIIADKSITGAGLTISGPSNLVGTVVFDGSIVTTPKAEPATNDLRTRPTSRVLQLTGNGANIKNIGAGASGQELILLCGTAKVGILTGGNIKLNGLADFNMEQNDILHLLFDGANWLEMGRSVNH